MTSYEYIGERNSRDDVATMEEKENSDKITQVIIMFP